MSTGKHFKLPDIVRQTVIRQSLGNRDYNRPNYSFYWPQLSDAAECPSIAQKMLCELCETISLQALTSEQNRYPGILHHESWTLLCRAAAAGCPICLIFKDAVLKEYCEVFNWDEIETELYHVERDSAAKTKFYIQVINVDLDPRFSPFSSGYYGLWYIRRALTSDGEFDEEEDDSIFPTTKLYTSGCSDEIEVQSYHVVGRHTDVQANFDLANFWINTCRQSHPECNRPRNFPLPTRLIDVGSLNGNEEPRLVETAGQLGEYVALSHCWGGSTRIVTNHETYQSHLQAIPFNLLPRTFQDAVITVRTLGFQYLWIDCFCIIQGDEEDWERECAGMAQTFKGSTVTIAGAAAGSTEAGFLHRRNIGPAPAPFVLRLTESSDLDEAKVLLGPAEYSDRPLPGPEPDSPLARRAWILQERLLSTRILYFGSRKMYWECHMLDWYEDMHYPYIDLYQAKVQKKSLAIPTDTRAIYDYWYSIVMTYADCNLTDGADQLPALSGLASEIYKKCNDTYLAGLWKNDLMTGLLWWIIRQSEDQSRFQRKTLGTTGPSWSWASSEYSVHFLEQSSRRSGNATLFDMQIVDVTSSVLGLDPFGKVNRGLLKAMIRLRPGLLRKAYYPPLASYKIFLYNLGSDETKIAEFYPDHPSRDQADSDTPYSTEVICALLCKKPNRWFALALEIAAGPMSKLDGPMYRRVGMLESRSQSKALEPYRESSFRWFDECEPELVEIT